MLRHCWLKLKDYPKWKERFSAWHNDGSKRRANDSWIDLEEDGPSSDGPIKDRPKRDKAIKTDLR
jgi:hypothetical protein